MVTWHTKVLKFWTFFSQCRNIVYNKKKRAKRDKRRAKKDSGSESSDSVQVEKPVPHPVEKVTPLHDRRMSLTEDLVQVEKTIEKPTISGKKNDCLILIWIEKSESESSESDSPSKKLTIGGLTFVDHYFCELICLK